MSEYKKVLAVAAVILVVLTAGVLVSYGVARNRTETIVLPGGVTYLGPSASTTATISSSTIPVPENAIWTTYQGKLFPYSFSYPGTLSLGVFPNDPFDSVTIFWGNTNPQENLLIRVEDLNKIPRLASYITKSKKEYALNWWRQYNYKSVASVTQSTNSHGLTGYHAKYLDASGAPGPDNIFFEVPGRPDLVIWMSTRLLDQKTFDRIADSVSWK